MYRRTRLDGIAVLIAAAVVPVLDARAQAVRFQDVAFDAGIQNTVVCSYFGAGAAAEDLDGDGDIDLVLANGPGVANRFFENRGDSRGRGHPEFVDRTVDAGLRDLGNTKGVACADYDGDGFVDLFFSTYDEGPEGNELPQFTSCITLYRNQGNGTFRDVTSEAGLEVTGLAAYGVSLADVDGDGFADLYVCNRGIQRHRGGQDRLYRNRGDGTFEDLSGAAGIADVWRMTFQGGFFDYDRDGDPDLFLAVDKLGGNRFYRNDGGFRFTNVSDASETNTAMNAMCVATGDYDGDGFLDIFVTNTHEGHVLYRNLGDGRFCDRATETGTGGNRNGWGSAWLDADNDGDLDLYTVASGFPARNQLFVAFGDGTFRDVAEQAGCVNDEDSYGVVAADFDANGSPDLLVTNLFAPAALFLNRGSPGRWLRVKLLGVESNPDAIGARLELFAGRRTWVREIQAGTSFLCHGPLVADFGLGVVSPESLQILWPSGRRETLRGLQLDREHRVVEGHGLQTRTVLLSHEVTAGPEAVRVTWRTVPWPGERDFSVWRQRIEGDVPIGTPALVAAVDGPGRLHAVEDPGLEPGTYVYRVKLRPGSGAERTLFESTLVVGPTPVLVEDFEAQATQQGVELRWTLRDPHAFAAIGVQRARSPSGPFADLLAPVLVPHRSMTYHDTGVEAGRSWYRLRLVAADGSSTASLAIDIVVEHASDRTRIEPGLLLPTGEVRIGYRLETAARVRLEVHDVGGRSVRQLVTGPRDAGAHTVFWNRLDASGLRVRRGVYFLRLEAGGEGDACKLVLLGD